MVFSLHQFQMPLTQLFLFSAIQIMDNEGFCLPIVGELISGLTDQTTQDKRFSWQLYQQAAVYNHWTSRLDWWTRHIIVYVYLQVDQQLLAAVYSND